MQTGKFLRRWSGSTEYSGYAHWCPGCKEVHTITTLAPQHPRWTFNGNLEKPTFAPSVRFFDLESITPRVERTTCHYVITDGEIFFCQDSEHELAGKKVPMVEWPYAAGLYGGIDE